MNTSFSRNFLKPPVKRVLPPPKSSINRIKVEPTVEQASSEAVIFNFSSHKVCESIITTLQKSNYLKLRTYNSCVHIENDKNVGEQTKDILTAFFEKANIEGTLPYDAPGDRFYISCGHPLANLLIYEAISSLVGSMPRIITTGRASAGSSTYVLKQILSLESWKGLWRSGQRKKYVLEESEVISFEPFVEAQTKHVTIATP